MVAARLLALGALLAATPAAAKDIAYYERNPRERAAVIRACENDKALDTARECMNARSAENRVWARSIRPDRTAPVPTAPAPWVTEGIARHCAQPGNWRFCPGRRT